MDTLVQKFYSNGKTFNDGFTQFGAFTTSFNKSTNFLPLARTTSAINPATHISLNTSQPQPLTQKIPMINTFQNTAQALMFNSSSDLIKPMPIPNYKGEYHELKQNEEMNNKKNATKIQMMEEKMKNLELKSQRLEVINDFFFDMFENNLVREEINKQREENLRKEAEEDEEEDEEDEYEEPKKRGVSGKKGGSTKGGKKSKKDNFDPKEFQMKTLKNAGKILKNIKKSVGEYMLEEQLKKNEELQSMTEDIIEIKTELQTRLKKIQHKQKLQMEGLAFILQNSGDPKIEAISKRLLDNPYFDYKNSMNTTYSPIKGNDDDNVSVSSKRKSMVGSIKHSSKLGPRMSILKSPSRLSALGGLNNENNIIHEENENIEENKEAQNSKISLSSKRSNVSNSPHASKLSRGSVKKRKSVFN